MSVGLMCNKVDTYNTTPAFKGADVCEKCYDTTADYDSVFEVDTTADMDTVADFDTVA